MKLEWKTCFRAGISIFLLFLCIHYWAGFAALCRLLAGAAGPLLLGCVLAYLLNILMSFYERHWFPAKSAGPAAKSRRAACMLLAMLTLVAVVVMVLRLVVPELAACIQLLAAELPAASSQLAALANQSEQIPPEFKAELNATLASLDWKAIFGQVASGVNGVMGAAVTAVSSVFSSAVTLLIGLIFSIYILADKDHLGAQCARLLRCYLPAAWYAKARYVLDVLNDCFHRYIVGQCIEAVILGALCTAGMLLFRFPYAAMVGALVGFTALIPVAGAYIGAGVGAFMILTVSPVQALLFLLFIVVLQQLEGNLIYPRVVGASMGLPGIWVLAAVTVGGGLFGVAGMLLGVPITAALYRLLRTDLHRREGAPAQAAAE